MNKEAPKSVHSTLAVRGHRCHAFGFAREVAVANVDNARALRWEQEVHPPGVITPHLCGARRSGLRNDL
jgi:hypothetical protein